MNATQRTFVRRDWAHNHKKYWAFFCYHYNNNDYWPEMWIQIQIISIRQQHLIVTIEFETWIMFMFMFLVQFISAFVFFVFVLSLTGLLVGQQSDEAPTNDIWHKFTRWTRFPWEPKPSKHRNELLIIGLKHWIGAPWGSELWNIQIICNAANVWRIVEHISIIKMENPLDSYNKWMIWSVRTVSTKFLIQSNGWTRQKICFSFFFHTIYNSEPKFNEKMCVFFFIRFIVQFPFDRPLFSIFVECIDSCGEEMKCPFLHCWSVNVWMEFGTFECNILFMAEDIT